MFLPPVWKVKTAPTLGFHMKLAAWFQFNGEVYSFEISRQENSYQAREQNFGRRCYLLQILTLSFSKVYCRTKKDIGYIYTQIDNK